jgi:hypothetical protein
VSEDTLIPLLVALGVVAVAARVAYKMGYDRGREDEDRSTV